MINCYFRTISLRNIKAEVEICFNFFHFFVINLIKLTSGESSHFRACEIPLIKTRTPLLLTAGNDKRNFNIPEPERTLIKIAVCVPGEQQNEPTRQRVRICCLVITPHWFFLLLCGKFHVFVS